MRLHVESACLILLPRNVVISFVHWCAFLPTSGNRFLDWVPNIKNWSIWAGNTHFFLLRCAKASPCFYGGVFLCPKYCSCVLLSQACCDYLLMIKVWTDKEVLYESIFLLQVVTLSISKCCIIVLWKNVGLLLQRAENMPSISLIRVGRCRYGVKLINLLMSEIVTVVILLPFSFWQRSFVESFVVPKSN